MSVTKQPYGTMPDGREVYAYTLSNGKISAEIINCGGIITKLIVKDKNGAETDVVLGRPSLDEYLNNSGYFGAAVGRNANRIANSKFVLNGKTYTLAANDGNNNLHGGIDGFNKKVWDVEVKENEDAIILSYISQDGEEGFPGTLDVKIKYSITAQNGLKIEYTAESDADTICNLTNHSYFNLGGHDSGKTDKHICQINSSFYTPNNDECIPTGEIHSVSGTPFDFRAPKPIGQDFDSDFEQIKMFNGYDHNFIIDGRGERMAARIRCEETGITVEVITDQPGVQLYTANKLDAPGCKNGCTYGLHNAYCFETQLFPNGTEYGHFPSPILKKGDIYSHIVEYRFI